MSSCFCRSRGALFHGCATASTCVLDGTGKPITPQPSSSPETYMGKTAEQWYQIAMGSDRQLYKEKADTRKLRRALKDLEEKLNSQRKPLMTAMGRGYFEDTGEWEDLSK